GTNMDQASLEVRDKMEALNLPLEAKAPVLLRFNPSTEHLNAMNQLGNLPWPLSFSYGRAKQQAALKLWAKDMKGNYAAARLCRGGTDGGAGCDRCHRAALAGRGRRPGDRPLPCGVHCRA
ncbi:class I fructose-bisphosphate aldolase, partial [Stenotrophomonas sp. 3diitr2024]|uniref:class I fructose-bisphosphate aldolase n=1 Tax=Stenotrophomonas sp. 3diitr2024 TaxID=3345115 RepID=UPI0035CBFC1C